jgi:hypothetical protein
VTKNEYRSEGPPVTNNERRSEGPPVIRPGRKAGNAIGGALSTEGAAHNLFWERRSEGPPVNRPGRKAGKSNGKHERAPKARHLVACAGPLGLIHEFIPTPSLRSGLFASGAPRLKFFQR